MYHYSKNARNACTDQNQANDAARDASEREYEIGNVEWSELPARAFDHRVHKRENQRNSTEDKVRNGRRGRVGVLEVE